MPRQEFTYPKEALNTVRRLNERASYALETIHTIVNQSPLVHVSFANPDSPFPAVLPMIGQVGSFDRPSATLAEPNEVYLHGYVSSRIMNLARKSDASSSDEPEGMPITIAAAHVDGLVLALTPNHHSYNYRSAVLYGYATLVTDLEEKLWAMQLITETIVPGRWHGTRIPPTNAEMTSTSILRVRVVSGSAKINTGQSKDDRADLENEDLTARVWTGVVPVYQTLGAPVETRGNKAALPADLEAWIKDKNEGTKEVAVKAAEA